jgi:hypothetical protein
MGGVKGLLANLLLAGGAVLAALLAAEPIVRFFRPFDMNQRAFAMRYDPVLGWSKAPHLKGVYAPGEEEVEALNSRGLRGREYPYAKPANEYRVLVLGDSFAEGRLVAFRDTTFEVLERELRGTMKDGRRVEVISAGTGGYSTDQALLFFTGEGRKYAPDLTVLMFYENDVWYNAQPVSSRGNKPLFELHGDELVLTRVPVPRAGEAADGAATPETPSVPGRLLAWIETNSALYQFVRDGVRGLPPVSPPSAGPVPDEFRVWMRTYDDQVRYAWRVTEALLRELKRGTQDIGSELVVLYVPTAAEIHPDIWAATRRRYGLAEEEWDISRLERELGDVCRRNDIHFVDPAPDFRAEAARPWLERTPLYFETDPHWTPAGHALAGKVLAAYVEKTFEPGRSPSARR